MKKIAYFDCFAGISGDMILGAILDVGLELKDLQRELKRLPLKGYKISAGRVRRRGLVGRKVEIKLRRGAGKGISVPKDILAIIRKSDLADRVKTMAGRVFQEMAKAEARVHGARLPKVHFHELGAVDTIIDVVGSIVGLQMLGVEEVYASSLPWSSGTVECAHGKLPVPSPATTELMSGVKVYRHHVVGELVTPTGAAILKSYVDKIGYMPPMTVKRVGYGAGNRRLDEFPNLLRLVLGETEDPVGMERVAVVETEIDDMTPTIYEHLQNRLFASGAVDVFTTPVLMKKNRMGQLLTVLCKLDLVGSMAEVIFEESTTLGVRYREENRIVLPRLQMKVKTDYGMVQVKLARRSHGEVTIAPEYDECARIALDKKVPIRKVMASALRAAEAKINKGGVKFKINNS